MSAHTTYAKQGSIPACAGEPIFRAAGISSVKVYPRLRGGTACGGADFGWREGLSPLARGNH